MKKPYIINESGYHISAKKILCEWLETGGFNDFKCSSGKLFGDGVFMEYPLIKALNEYESCGFLSFNYHTGDERGIITLINIMIIGVQHMMNV